MMLKIVNEKEVALWSPSYNWAMLDVIGLGFINKWRFLRFLKKHGYKGKLFLLSSFTRFSLGENEIRTVISVVSPYEMSGLKVTLTEIGVFDGETIYFLKQLECMGLP